MMKRILAASFGALLFCVIVPIAYFVAFEGFPLNGLTGIAVLAGGGAVLGAIVGALFPRFFGFVFDVMVDL